MKRLHWIWVTICLLSMFAGGCGNPYNSEDKKVVVKKKTPVAAIVDGSAFIIKRLPQGVSRIDANFEKRAILLGYSINKDTLAPGEAIIITWYWKSLKPISGSWEYFTHIMDADGIMVSSVNSRGAMRSKFKPQMWKPGQIIKDVERIVVPADWKSNVLELRTGLWQGSLRLAVTKGPVDEENRAKGPIITINANAAIPAKILKSSATIDVPFTKQIPNLDGDLEDLVWAKAGKLASFSNTTNGSAVRSSTEVKLLWKDNALFVGAKSMDKELLSKYEKGDPDLWRADAINIFLQGQGTAEYMEIQVSPLGVVYDSKYQEYRQRVENWESGVKVAVKVDGDVNAAEQTDVSWTMEAMIPLTGLIAKSEGAAPGEQSLRGNFFRINKSANLIEYSGWSPPLRGDFHTVERFGQINLKGAVK